MSHENKRPVTVEDLLRLKRNEQPSAEFWAGFDRQLRAKQLTALVEKRPWWQRIQLLPAGFAWRKYHLPLGAVAALAITLVSVRNYHGSAPELPAGPVNSSAAPIAAIPAAAVPAVESLSAFRSGHESAPAVVAVVAEPGPAAEQAREPAAAATLVAVDVGPVTPFLGIEAKAPLLKDNAPIAADFAALPMSDSVITGGLLATATAQSSEVQVAPSRPSRVEPLARMVVSSEAQGRGRLSAMAIAMLTTKLPQGPAEDVTARHASSLSSDRVYERPKGRLSSASGNNGFALNVGL
jgi:hypothetical protein